MKKNVFAGIILIALALSMVPGISFAHEGQGSSCVELSKSLVIGAEDTSSDNSVVTLQTFLHIHGYLSVEPTGYFGPLTFAAVKSFQKDSSIESIGIVGPLTRAAIKKTSCNETSAVDTPAPIASMPQSAFTTTVALPYKSTTMNGWRGTWGDVLVAPTGQLFVNAGATTQGAEAIFDGGAEWTDYRYTTRVFVSNGDVTLFARYVDTNNYVACTFYRNEIAIKERINGDTYTRAVVAVAEVPAAPFFKLDTSFSIGVKGSTVGCSNLGSDKVTYTSVSDTLSKGTIGVQTWTQPYGAATLILNEVTAIAQ